ncbi:hypothetical protein [Pseudooceanicola sp.]|uniref:hypothetical protein n=1 Tax=Pseudooceanicola sp. TaxID=1914328 RepID=UPI0026084357|nr:hypothetical protein [Pseudooceanicola sp.]MDF1854110.1 hypothetical protein [Pseudooceanicola sp.]
MSDRPALTRLIRQHPLALSLFALASLAALFFVVRTLVFMIYWTDPSHRDQTLEAWMTPRYIAHSWHVPPQDLAAFLRLPMPPPQRATLAEIAARDGVPVEQLIAELSVFLAAQSVPPQQAAQPAK